MSSERAAERVRVDIELVTGLINGPAKEAGPGRVT